MRKILLFIQNHQTRLSGIVLFVVSVAVVVYLNPREIKFKYEFQKGKPWLYENLVADFDFPVFKTEEEMAAEKELLKENKPLFLEKDSQVKEGALQGFENDFDKAWDAWIKDKNVLERTFRSSEYSKEKRNILKAKAISRLNAIYTQGVLKPFEGQSNFKNEVYLEQGGLSHRVKLDDFHNIQSAGDVLKLAFTKEPVALRRMVVGAALDQINYNVSYEPVKTENYLQSQIEAIVPAHGAVQEGELIVAKGNIVDDDKFAKLHSLSESYKGTFKGKYGLYLLLFGQIMQIGLLFTILYVFIKEFRRPLLEDVSRLTFVLVNILLMVGLVRVVLSFGVQYVYIIPFTILPIVLRSFFDTRLALFVNTLVILICGIMLPNSFEFIYLQFVAGIFSVVMVKNLYRRAQLFVTAGKIVLAYCLSYLSIAIIQEGSLEQINWLTFAFFGANGLLVLMCFPLIYFQEKIFGFVSDVSLLELSDTNSPLLRKLAQEAPGTFQHSMQVANLAEAAILKIDGNALLARTGALYHDIGKISNPMYFIENQQTGFNPHDELSFEESAEMIINHVKDGIRLAKKNNLPDVLIDFIRTHHGTSTVMYFYKKYVKNFPDSDDALAKFTYPGPKPFSKETAALMMADSVEAASRSLKSPNHEQIDKLVEGIIDHQMSIGQFENADITIREVKEIKKIFKKMLLNIYHVRVQYPE